MATKSKYGKLVLKDATAHGPAEKKVDQRAIALSEEATKELGVFDISFQFVGQIDTHQLNDPPHTHDVDEFLFFIPGDAKTAPNLGGEMEVGMGDGWEKLSITTGAVICIPAGVSHCPVFTKRVDKPFYFGHCVLYSRYQSSVTPPEDMAP